MSAKRSRIGIMGAGAMGSTHAAAYRAIAEAEIVSVWSRSPARAARAAQIAGARAVAEVAAVLNDPAIEIVDVCVPSAAHRDLVIAALARGKHVICETPFALDLADGAAMIAAAKAADRLLLVGLLTRSIAAYAHIRDQAASGSLGRVHSVAAYRLGSYLRPGGSDAKPHYSDPSTELMTFDFDFLNWLLGKPASLAAAATDLPDGRPGEISALLRYASGATAVVTGSGIMPASAPYTVGLRVLFEAGAFELTSVFNERIPDETFLFHPERGRSRPVAIPGHNPYERELRHCLDCVRTGTASPLLGADQALAALRLSLATRQALREHRTIVFEA
jgi:predicted dehydrogenase